ncbi:MAG: hypothetical protein Q4F11_07690 [Eubacteriales bacterium]|nr:hypothetical protein [Eubacteriales bacterium]
MTDEQKEIINKMFMRYGSPSGDVEIQVRQYLIHPQDLNELQRITHYDESAAKAIEEMQREIEKLQTYRTALCEQYNFIATAPKQKMIKLQRERLYSNKKVFYYVIELERNMLNNSETVIKSTKYEGKDRKKAFDDFEKYIKLHPDAVQIKDITKGYWER